LPACPFVSGVSLIVINSRVVFVRQLWAVNSAGRSAGPWAEGRTGPAPPEGVGAPVFLRVSATSALVTIHPPARPNGVVSLYRVFSVHHGNHTLVNLTPPDRYLEFHFSPALFFPCSLPPILLFLPLTQDLLLNYMTTHKYEHVSPFFFPLPVALGGDIPPADAPRPTRLHSVLGRSRGLHLLPGNGDMYKHLLPGNGDVYEYMSPV